MLVDGTSHLGRCHKSLEEVLHGFMPYFEETSILKKVACIIVEDIPHWRRSRRFQTLDLGFIAYFEGRPSFRSSYLLTECPDFHQINAIRCKVAMGFPKCGHNRNSDKN
jgi:hypothetical protein